MQAVLYAEPAFPGGAIDVAMLGARMGYALPATLARAGMLGTFYTDLYAPRFIRSGPALRWVGVRHHPDLEARQVRSFPGLGLKASLIARWTKSRADKIRHYARINREFGLAVAHDLKPAAGPVYAFNGAALEIFARARALGRRCILEQSSAPSRVEAQLLMEEARRWPGWEPGPPQTDSAIAEREEAEWELADRIICGSHFAAHGLHSLGVPEKWLVIPYGIDLARFRKQAFERSDRGPLRVLFVGNLGLQKGAPYLVAAIRQLGGGVICRAIGPISLTPHRLTEVRRVIEVEGPRPRREVQDAYRWADVLVLPSLCEGSALVVYEAMACGRPVIVTPHTGAVARDGRDGFVVPIRDSEMLAARIESLADPELRRAMGDSARSEIEKFALPHYLAALRDALGAAPTKDA